MATYTTYTQSRHRAPETLDMNTLVWPPPPTSMVASSWYSKPSDKIGYTQEIYTHQPSRPTANTKGAQRLNRNHLNHSSPPMVSNASSARATSPVFGLSAPPPRIRRPIHRFHFDENNPEPLESRQKRSMKEIRPPTPGYAMLDVNRRLESPPPLSFADEDYGFAQGSRVYMEPYISPQRSNSLERDRRRRERNNPSTLLGLPTSYLEQKWLDDFRHSLNDSTRNRTIHERSTSSRTPNDYSYPSSNMPLHNATPSPLRQAPLAHPHSHTNSQSYTSSSSISSPSMSSIQTPLQGPHGPIPTRKGYWNKRGDTIIFETGHIRRAPRSQLYPPDLAHYPKYALMNEDGDLILPAREEDRVYVWRSYLES